MVIILGSAALAWPLARRLGTDPRALAPTVVSGNVGPVGLPVSMLAFGTEGLAPALLPVLSDLLLFTLGARLVATPWHAWRIGSLGGVAAAVLAMLPLEPLQRGTLFVFAALPPAVFNFLLADRYQRAPDDVASMVLVDPLLALLFLPVGLALAFGG
ncbi:hypothetical protein [uncultured Piscinibacter sp.]|uniref:hypothetical protein n=1 Tax=uncultured Piscinibacter sp. TaxID=1131835 RepID=UPI002607F97B|nr:hypothetical protein [uncultured Piscinibacter sp.]